jgi:cobalamin biosynthesis Mg chelatase CobN
MAEPYPAPHSNPQATAEAARQRADELSGAAAAARATENAAWAQATAAVQATAQAAQATATAQAVQATTTAQAATAQAAATRQAIEIRLTSQAADIQATQAAYDLSVTATADAQVATAQAAQAELDRLAVQRARTLQPLVQYGPWILVLIAVIGLVAWRATYWLPQIEAYLVAKGVIDYGRWSYTRRRPTVRTQADVLGSDEADDLATTDVTTEALVTTTETT